MGVLKQPDGKPVLNDVSPTIDRLDLYEKYGAMAYGIILQIVPQPELAQQALVTLFLSPQLEQCIGPLSSPACAIVRLARLIALEVNPVSLSAKSTFPDTTDLSDENKSKQIFDLSFRQGYELSIIAERLKIPYTEVMASIRNYFQYLRRP
ncbi:hypothetical protein WBJ53_28845 [Spirosoma sp. SC4-14]|uniref:hypothetical protein n=1 Tax=Spirosoma sp. SC4-14 TaxID=3128900 RepID=UPI0030D21883